MINRAWRYLIYIAFIAFCAIALVFAGLVILTLLELSSQGQSCVTNSQVTLTGTFRGANGIVAKNYTMALVPSQQGYIAGCGVNIPTTNTCATSTDGSMVGVPNPLTTSVNTTSGSGSLGSGVYFSLYEWYDAAGHVTLASPETAATLSGTGSLVVNPPSSGIPSNAVGMDVFIGTTSGGETLQGQTTGSASYVQSSALTSGAAPASTNTTLCQVTANDSVWPTGTGYNVSLTTAQGNPVPGYPMQWQLLGGGTTYNLSNGLPYYHGVVFYPVPILAAPQNHGTQSISGNLSLGGYAFTAGQINNVFYPTTFAVLQSELAGCTSGSCIISINTPISVTSNTTVPSGVELQLQGAGQLNLSTGVTLTVNGIIDAAPAPIFAGPGSVVFGAQVSLAPVEWFGAVGQLGPTLPATDSTAAIQACLTAMAYGNCQLQAVTYKTSSALSITKSNVGIIGTTYGLNSPTLYPNPFSSAIETTSATADIVDIAGTSVSNNIGFNQVKYLTLARSVIPTGTASGLSLSFVYGAQVDSVTSADSVRGFYLHGNGGQGNGYIANSVAIWGYSGLTEAAGPYYGFYIDSADGTPSNSQRIRHVGVFSALSSTITTYGLYAYGSMMNDQEIENFETAQVSYGEYFQYTSGGNPGTDVHLRFAINDGCWVSCIFLQQLSGAIEITGGWDFKQGTNAGHVIDLETSDNVNISGVQLYYPTAGTGYGVYINGGGSNTINGNQFPKAANVNVRLQSTSLNIVANNSMTFGTGSTSIPIIQLLASSNNVIANNGIFGVASTGISLDSSSNNNTGLDTNSIVTSSFSGAAITNAGTNPAAFRNGMTVTGTITNGSNTVPNVGTPTVNQAACIKAAGPPVVIGYCSTVVSSGGACTCN